LSPITHNHLITFLKEYVQESGRSVDLLLVGGLALQAYGYADRSTQDVEAEVAGDLDSLARFLRQHQVPADLGENISGWSVVAMPPGYRERASVLLEDSGLRLRLLHPVLYYREAPSRDRDRYRGRPLRCAPVWRRFSSGPRRGGGCRRRLAEGHPDFSLSEDRRSLLRAPGLSKVEAPQPILRLTLGPVVGVFWTRSGTRCRRNFLTKLLTLALGSGESSAKVLSFVFS
jgi:hypothetical protein